MPLLNFSRMAGRGGRGRGRGRGANDPPPPPDYMDAMMQQFELNQVFMQGVIDQLQNQNQNKNQSQMAVVTLRDFVRLNPPTFHQPEQPLDADDWHRDITRQLELASVHAADYVSFTTY